MLDGEISNTDFVMTIRKEVKYIPRQVPKCDEELVILLLPMG